MMPARVATLVALSAFAAMGFRCHAQDEPRVVLQQNRSLNDLILAEIRAMPSGGGYATNSGAHRALSLSTKASPGRIIVSAERAQPSYCSGATYLVFLRVVDRLLRDGSLSLDEAALKALEVKGQPDGVGVWGRWNANGPGTARLFHELGVGRNFTEFAQARPGDFMKIWWTKEIGSHERGHSVIYLGTENRDGQQYVRFWSSNKPEGYGEKAVPMSKVARALFSRFEHPSRLNGVAELPNKDQYLADMLKRPSSPKEMAKMCGYR